MLRRPDSISFAAIATILMLTATGLPAVVTYDWTSTDGGGSGTVVFNGTAGATADPGDMLSFTFSNAILSDWSLADRSGSWTIPLSLTPALTPQNSGLVFYFERDTGEYTKTLKFYYNSPPVEGGPPVYYEFGGPGWFWQSISYPGMAPSDTSWEPEYQKPQEYEIPEEGDPPPLNPVLVGEDGSGQWGLPDGSGPLAVPVPTSLLLALTGVGIGRATLLRRGPSPRRSCL
ncbi:MAG: hypothetical protein JW741_26510 [Sedimentisphaerales bacterium]|nr:hypothetical protein [Sedimentisphaerales bacterium]